MILKSIINVCKFELKKCNISVVHLTIVPGNGQQRTLIYRNKGQDANVFY